jgi:hypothetical protein
MGDSEELYWSGVAADGSRIAVFVEGKRWGVRCGPHWFDCATEWEMWKVVEQLVSPACILEEACFE